MGLRWGCCICAFQVDFQRNKNEDPETKTVWAPPVCQAECWVLGTPRRVGDHIPSLMECLYLNIREREEICLVWHHYHHPVYLQTHQVPFPVHNCFIIFPRSQKPPVSQTPQTPLNLQMFCSWVDGSVVCDGGWVWLKWSESGILYLARRDEGIASELEAEKGKRDSTVPGWGASQHELGKGLYYQGLWAGVCLMALLKA